MLTHAEICSESRADLFPVGGHFGNESPAFDFDSEAVTIPKGEQIVHDPKMAVTIGNTKNKRRYIKCISLGFSQILFRSVYTGLILGHAHIGGLLRESDQCTEILLYHVPQLCI